MSLTEESKVLVTGAAGLSATHVIQMLLRQGRRVRGSVRDLQNEAKIKPIRELCPEAADRLELVEADLTVLESWDRAVDGCSHVLHLATPFTTMNLKDPEKEVIEPYVQGTLAILRACQAHHVTRVVITSSVATMTGAFGDPQQPGRVFSEADWVEVNKNLNPYIANKALAEKAAWEFVEQLPDGEKFELAVINPSLVFGPVLCGPTTSIEVPQGLMERSVPLLPKIYFQVCDVRDLAEAILKAMVLPEAAGHRHAIVSKSMWYKDIAAIIDKEFRPQGYNIPTWQCPNFLISFFGMFDPLVRMISPYLGLTCEVDNTRMRTVLGVEGRDIEHSLLDMCYSLVDRGMVKQTDQYRGRPTTSTHGSTV